MENDNILQRFARGKLSADELERLRSLLATDNDDVIQETMYQEWMKFSSDTLLHPDKKRLLFPAIYGHRQRSFYIMTAVAAVLLVVTTVMSCSLFRMKHDVSELSAKEITIKADGDGHTALTLPDGSLVRLNSRSTLSYSSDFGVRDRRVNIIGEGFFDVAKDSDKEFVVSSQGMDVIVCGTKFNIYAYEELEFMEMSLIEGSVNLRYGDSFTEVTPNEKVCIDKLTGRVNLHQTDNEIETSWMKNTLVFMHDPLYKVIDVLQRRFGVVIRCSDDIVLSDIYTGTFTDRSIDDILAVLNMHYGFVYELNGNTINITLK